MHDSHTSGPSDPPNGFDHLRVDVPRLFATPADRHPALWTHPLLRLYRQPLLPLSTRRLAWGLLRRTGLDESWFQRFRRYWSQVLGGRPLWGPEDFHFLRNHYRMKFQRSRAVPADAGTAEHVAVWQEPEVLSHLFHSVYKELRFHQLDPLSHLRHASGRVRRILEFGCGVAPVCTSLVEFADIRIKKVFIADIETISFHYARWKLAEFPQVHPVSLRPADQFHLQVDPPLDAIFCLAVFEHLPAPLETIRTFYRLLRPGGVLIFDYIVSEAEGLDTAQGLAQRREVIAYLQTHFEVCHGRLDPEQSMPLTVVKPRAHAAPEP